MRRPDEFHVDARLPPGAGAVPQDFWHSGFDAGHMAPDGDMPDAEAQYESFALSNVVPQDPDDNRGVWADIEYAVRGLVLRRHDEVYVVTGPIFELGAVRIRGGVMVPAWIFKAIYNRNAAVAGVYLVRNAPGDRYEIVSLDAFTHRFGSVPFSALAGHPIAAASRALPKPKPHTWP